MFDDESEYPQSIYQWAVAKVYPLIGNPTEAYTPILFAFHEGDWRLLGPILCHNTYNIYTTEGTYYAVLPSLTFMSIQELQIVKDMIIDELNLDPHMNAILFDIEQTENTIRH